MNVVKGSKTVDLGMEHQELEEFKRYLAIAAEDLVNVRPENPKKYLALALCRALPADESLRNEFPELGNDLTFEKSMKVVVHEEESLYEEFPESPSKNPNYKYPEGFKIERRGSVCGESFVEEDLTESPPLYPKSPEVVDSLKAMLKRNVLFAHLSENNLNTLALALENLELEAGMTVVQQHEEGDSCFFIETGRLSCFVEERGYVCEYTAGDSFGEASIMYGNIRGATIKVNFI